MDEEVVSSSDPQPECTSMTDTAYPVGNIATSQYELAMEADSHTQPDNNLIEDSTTHQVDSAACSLDAYMEGGGQFNYDPLEPTPESSSSTSYPTSSFTVEPTEIFASRESTVTGTNCTNEQIAPQVDEVHESYITQSNADNNEPALRSGSEVSSSTETHAHLTSSDEAFAYGRQMSPNSGVAPSDAVTSGEAGNGDVASDDVSSAADAGKSLKQAELEKYWAAVSASRQDFTAWTYLLEFVEQEIDVTEVIRAYDEFFLYYPFCYGYWKKYADFIQEHVGLEAAKQVYDRSVQAVPLSVDIWISYIEFAALQGWGPEETRLLFNQALDACGLDFRSERLWEKYVEYEYSLGAISNVTSIYRRLMSLPTRCYSSHYENLKVHIDSHEPVDLLTPEELLEVCSRCEPSNLINEDVPPGVTAVSSDELGSRLLARGDPSNVDPQTIRAQLHADYLALYTQLELEVSKRWNFEDAIRRPYFHVKSLDKQQLKNWRDYTDFEIKEGSERRCIILFERCVIACALYEEFWIKYANFLEGLGKVSEAREIYRRACYHHLPYKASTHITWSFFEEKHGNYQEALDIISQIELRAPANMCVMSHRLNLMRRHGDDLCALYESYVELDKLPKDAASLMLCKYARYLLKIKNDVKRASDLLRDRIPKDSGNEQLYLQLLDVEYQRFPMDEDAILSIFDLVQQSPVLSPECKLRFGNRRYEFVDDFGSDVNRLYKVYLEHDEALAEANEKKRSKQSEDGTAGTPANKKAKRDPSSLQLNQPARPQTNNAYYDYYAQNNGWSDYYSQYPQYQYGDQATYTDPYSQAGYNQWQSYGYY